MITKQELLDIIASTSFKGLTPDQEIGLPKPFEECNAVSWNLTEFDGKDRLEPLRSVTGMSTPAYANIINTICRSMSEDQLYLNIGCYQGFTLLAGMIDTKCRVIGIDNFSQFGGPKEQCIRNFNKFARDNTQFYDVDYREYLASHAGKIDFYFYDGHHSYDNQYKAMVDANKFLEPGCLVLVDDTNVGEVSAATFKAMEDLGRKYDVWVDIKTAHNKHPTYWNGLILLEIL
jgi:hypothetical protein